ncbi:MAG: PaaI family thioesterase [Candidatus Odinarchaeota archaeon]
MEPLEITNTGFANCFGCSKTNMHGLQLRIWYTDDGCFSKCAIPDHFCGFEGVVHGGIIASLLDELAAWTIISHMYQTGITLEVNIRYLKAVLAGTEIIVKGKIIHNDGKNATIYSSIHSEDGSLLAECESKWLLPSNSTLAKVIGVEESKVEEMMKRIEEMMKQTLEPIKRLFIEKTDV